MTEPPRGNGEDEVTPPTEGERKSIADKIADGLEAEGDTEGAAEFRKRGKKPKTD
jgi:hypothetical protein